MRDGSGGRAAPDPDQEMRARTERAVLQLSGELGYHEAGIRAVLERSGSSRFRFYRTWRGKEECYSSAYAGVAEELCRRIVEVCETAPGWAGGLGAALKELEAFVVADRSLALGVIREVHVAGGAALAKRGEIVLRLADAIDRGRTEIAPGGHVPPPTTAGFLVAAIEAALIRGLSERRPIGEVLGGVLFLAVGSYLGSAAARQALSEHPDWA